MTGLQDKHPNGWMTIGLAAAVGVVVGLALRPYGHGSAGKAAAIAAMQIITLSGAVSAVMSRIPSGTAAFRLGLAMVASSFGLFAGCWGILPLMDVVQLVVAAALWDIFLFGSGAATGSNRPDRTHLPVMTLMMGLILPLWPIVASPLIGVGSGGVTGDALNFVLGSCPSIWVIHITQSSTGMNLMGWFHSHLLYRVVPLGQNVLMRKTVPWYWMAGGLGLVGWGLNYLAVRRANRRQGVQTQRLASAR